MRRSLETMLEAAAARQPESSFSITLPGGRERHFGTGPAKFSIELRTRRALRRTVSRGFLGFGEGYMDGEIEVRGDWDRLFRVGFATGLAAPPASWPARLVRSLQRLRDRATPAGARRNAAHHYDLGNDFYRLWLDRSMTYSCAYFHDGGGSLEDAQDAKHELICRKLGLEPGHRLLDVGCGWGALLIYAAVHHGITGVGCTLSAEQARLARQRVAELGLADRLEIRLSDYREIDERYDRWVSVGMCEHVGRHFIPGFVDRARRQLRPGGRGLLHTIGKDRPGSGEPWILKYIFPGGHIPTLAELTAALAGSELQVLDVENLRPHYATTLDAWRSRFEDRAGEVEDRYGAPFVRMWRLYLASCAGSFRYGSNRVFQVLFSNGDPASLPRTRTTWAVPRPSRPGRAASAPARAARRGGATAAAGRRVRPDAIAPGALR